MLSCIFHLTTAVAAMWLSLAGRPPLAYANRTTGEPWYVEHETRSCILVRVFCTSTNRCFLQALADKRVFCNELADEAGVEIPAGQSVLVETVPLPGRVFGAFAERSKGVYPISVPANAKSCILKIAFSGVSLDCEFDFVLPADYVVDFVGGDVVVRKAAKEVQQGKPNERQTSDHAASSSNTAVKERPLIASEVRSEGNDVLIGYLLHPALDYTKSLDVTYVNKLHYLSGRC